MDCDSAPPSGYIIHEGGDLGDRILSTTLRSGGRSLLFLILVLPALLAGSSPASNAPSLRLARADTAGSGSATHEPGELLVKFRAGIPAGRQATALAGLPVRERRAYPLGWQRVILQGSMTTDEAIAGLRGHPDIEHVEPNYLVRVTALPDDPRFSVLHGLRNTGQLGGSPGADIAAEAAWDVTTGDREVVVGIVDTGIDYEHPDLAGNIWINTAEIAGNGIDDDGNGFVDDVRGWDFVAGDNDPMDDNGHGTHVAGTVGAVGNNGRGVTGVAWKVRLLPLKFLGANGLGNVANAVAAIDYATSLGVDITNNSWSGPAYSRALEEAIRAAGEREILFVAASGNTGTDNDRLPAYPASYELPNILAVTATDPADLPAPFANVGSGSVHLGAPGVSVFSTLPGDRYGTSSGTSMASPHVAGAAALIRSLVREIPVVDLRRLILDGVDPVPSLAGLTVTGGRLNAYRPISDRDAEPPGTVGELSVLSVGSNTVRLGWFATGDDGEEGLARGYEVLYAVAPADPSQMMPATLLDPAPTPQPAGSAESVEVVALEAATTYAFVVRARDDWGNRGPDGEIVWATTLPPPGFDASPGAFEVLLVSGETATRQLVLRNDGAGRLDWSIPNAVAGGPPSPPPSPAAVLEKGEDDPRIGRPVDTDFGGPDAYGYRWIGGNAPGGPAFDWVDIQDAGTQLPLDGDDQLSAPIALGFEFPFYGERFDIVRVSTNGWLAFTPGTARFTNQPLPHPVAPAHVIAPFWDDLDFAGSPRADYVIDDHGLTLQFSGVRRFSGPGLYTFQVGLERTGEITFRYLSMSGRLDEATIGIQNGDGTTGLDIAFNTAFIEDGLELRITPSPLWLAAAPTSGRLGPGESESVTLFLDALGLEPGSYENAIQVESNAPGAEVVERPVSLEVTGAPALRVAQEQLDFGSVVVGAVRTLAVGVENVGSEALVVSTSVDGSEAVVVSAGLTLEPGAQGAMTVSYAPEGITPLDATLTLDSNAPANRRVRLPLSGRGVLPPQLSVAPATLFSNLPLDASETRLLEVANVGGGAAELRLTFEPDSPESAAPPLELVNGGFEFGSLSGWTAETNGLPALSPWDVIGEGAGFFGNSAPREGLFSATNGFDGVAGLEFRLSREIEIPPGANPVELSFYDRLSYDSLGIISELPRVYEASIRDSAGNLIAPIIRQEIFLNGSGFNDTGWVRRAVDLSPFAGSSVRLEIVENVPESFTGPASIEFDEFRLDGSRFPDWLLNDVGTISIPSGGSVQIALTFVSGNRPSGTLSGRVLLYGPSFQAPLAVPVQLTISGTPRLSVDGGPRTLESLEAFFSSGAETLHRFSLDEPPASGGGTVELRVTGDFGATTELATVSAEGRVLGAVGGAVNDCIPSTATFGLAEEVLGQLAADGEIEISVRNSSGVGSSCLSNLHRVRLRYRVSVSRIDLGALFVGSRREATLIVRNDGTAPLEVTAGVGAAPQVTVAPSDFVLAPGQQGTIRLTLDAIAPGGVSGNLQLASNDPARPLLEIPIAAMIAARPTLDVAPMTLTETVFAGQSIRRGVTLSNVGQGPLEYTASLSPASTTFARLPVDAGTVDPGESAELEIELRTAGLAVGLHPVNVRIDSNDPERPRFTVPLELTVVGAPHLSIVERVLRSSTATFFEQDTTQLVLEVDRDFVGGANLELLATGDFSAFGEAAVLFLEGRALGAASGAPADCQTASRTFSLAPQELNLLLADGRLDLVVRNSPTVDPLCPVNQHTVRLDYGREPALLDFGRVKTRARGLRELSLENHGSEPLLIEDVETTAPEFAVRFESLPIPPGGALPITLEFHALDAGTFQGSLTVRSDDPLQPERSVPLVAVAEWTDLRPIPELIDLNLAPGDQLTRTVLLDNPHPVPLELGVAIHSRRPGSPEFVRATSETVSVPAAGSAALELQIDTTGLTPGEHEALVLLAGDGTPGVSIRVRVEIVAAPNLTLRVDPVAIRSEKVHQGRGSVTVHELPVGVPPGGDAAFELTLNGDFGAESERAEIRIDGLLLGSIGSTGNDCSPVDDTLFLDGETFAALSADGRIEVEIENSDTVDIICTDNTHGVRLVYDGDAGRLDFGRLFLGDSRERSIQLGNAGTGPLHVTSLVTDLSDVEYSAQGMTLAPGETRTVTLRWTPAGVGAHDGGLFIQSNDPDRPVTSLSVAALAIDPPVLSVAAVVEETFPQGALRPVPLQVANAGGSALTYVATLGSFSPEEPLPFATLSGGEGSLIPAESIALDLVLDARGREPGIYRAELTLATNDPDRRSSTIPLRLTVSAAPEIVGPGERVELTSIQNFLPTFGRSSHRFPLTVPAAGEATLRVIVSGDYGAATQSAVVRAEGVPLGTVAGPTGPCGSLESEFPIDDEAMEALDDDGFLDVGVRNSDDVGLHCSSSRHALLLSYIGLPEVLDFGTVFVGREARLPLFVANNGSEPLHVQSIVGDLPQLTLASAPRTVGPGRAEAADIVWTPSAAGPIAGSFTIISDDPDEPRLVVQVRGSAVPAPLAEIGPPFVVAALPPFDRSGRVRTLSIDNAGPGELSWAATLQDAVADVPRGGPDAFGYVFVDSDAPDGPPFEWNDISGQAVVLPLSGDDQLSDAVPLGFAFPFYGGIFDEVRISTNGWLSPTASRDSYSNAQVLPSTGFSVPRNLIAPFWDDLHLRGAERIGYLADGTRFVVQFTAVDRFVTGAELTFQVVLHPDGRIAYHYLTMAGVTHSATIGIQNGHGTVGLLVAYNAAYARDRLAVEFRPLPAWVSLTRSQATVAPFSEDSVALELSSAELASGDYHALAVVRSNDPDTPAVSVPVTLHVGEIEANSVRFDLDPGVPGRVEAIVQLPPGYDPRRVVPSTVSVQDRVFAEDEPFVVEDRNGDGIPEAVLSFDADRFRKLLRPATGEPLRIRGEIRDRVWFRGSGEIEPGGPLLPGETAAEILPRSEARAASKLP